MPILTGTIDDVTGSPLPDRVSLATLRVTVRAPSRRSSLAEQARLVASVPVPVEVSPTGEISVELEPGPAVMLVEGEGLRDVYELGVTADMTLLTEALQESSPTRSWVESQMVQLRAATVTAAGDAQAAKSDAEGAAAVAEGHRTHVDAIRDLLDEAAQTNVAPYLTETALNATYETQESAAATYLPGVGAGARGWNQVPQERRPVMAIDAEYPNAQHDYQIVYVSSTEMFAVGADLTLRRSTNGGQTWDRLGTVTTSLGSWARYGLFLKTKAGSLITTYHPFANTPPAIQRSTDGGITWATVLPEQPNVDYLGPTSICQDPNTGKLYLTEYVTAPVTTQPTWKISVSSDDGATWSTFHTFQRDAAAHPQTAVRHGHSIQWDPIGQRIWFLCGDSEGAAGLYRVNAAGTGVEPVVMNRHLNQADGQWAGAVGVMFFPDAVAWGCDQVSTSGLLILPRSEIGKATPVLISGPKLQSTSWYTARVKSDNTEWILTTSSEQGAGGRLDNLIHVYRVADNGQTIDEIASWSTASPTANHCAWAPSDPLMTRNDGRVWLCTNASQSEENNPYFRGFSVAARLGYGYAPIPKPSVTRPHHYAPSSVSSGFVSVPGGGVVNFGATEAPTRTQVLHVIEVAREQFSTGGAGRVEIVNASTGQVLKMIDGATDMSWLGRSQRWAQRAHCGDTVFRSVGVSPGTRVYFRLRNESTATAAEMAATITYAWGY